MSKFPVLTLEGYETIPALKELHSFSSTDLCRVSFSIKNRYGTIQFIPKVDLTNINLDKIISITQSEVSVYKTLSPKLNTELNVPAIIKLNSCQKHESIEKVKKITEKQQAEFISYSPVSGEWVFKVFHFTRYTFNISESESEDEPIIDIPIDLSMNTEPLQNSKRPREDFQPQIIPEQDVKPLNFRSGFRIGISPQGKVFLPAEDGTLVRYYLNFDNAEAEIGLNLQIEELRYASHNSNPNQMEFLENFWFKLAQAYTGMDTIPSEAMLWSLFCVLFGNPNISPRKILDTLMSTDDIYLNHDQKQLQRKKALHEWLSAWDMPFIESHDPGENILNMILNGKITESVKYACEMDYPVLANLISQTSTDFIRKNIQDQIDKWKYNDVLSTFPKSISNLYNVLAGNIGVIQNINWKQQLLLRILYKHSKNTDISMIFSELNFQSYPEPLSDFNEDLADICYSLLQVFCNPSFLHPDVLHPYTLQKHFSLGTSWVLYFSFTQLFKASSHFDDVNRAEMENLFREIESISFGFAEELINEGKWHLGVYVLSFYIDYNYINKDFKLLNCSNRLVNDIIKDIIYRNVHLDNNTAAIFEHLSLPSDLVDEAQALYDKYLFQFNSSFTRYLECSDYNKAYELVVNEIAPDLIIKSSGAELYTKLYTDVLKKLQIYHHQIMAWDLGGEVYIEYLELASVFENCKRPNTTDELFNLAHRIDRIFPHIQDFPKAVLKQKAAIGIMESNLNSWRLILCEAKEDHNLLSSYEKLQTTILCQNEDSLRSIEHLVYRYYKSASQLID